MSRLKAKRKLASVGKDGNWRFKGLLLAALPGTGVQQEDMAAAWPESGNAADYRFLADNSRYDAETEAKRTVIGEEGDDTHRLLRQHVKHADNTPKHLSDCTKDRGQRALGAPVDSAIKRTLFSASTFEEVDTLFREQLLETVMNGAERRRIARDASNVINADTRRGDIPVGRDETFGPEVAEGSEIRDDREEYTTVEFNTTKHAQGARITDEMVDHAMVDIIERQIEYVGTAVENAVNREWLNTLVDNADANFDTAGSDQGVPAINGAYGEVDKNDFIPDTFVTHPEYRTTLFDDSNIAFANRAGTDDVVRERVFDPLLGVEHYGASSSVYNSGNNTWGFSNDGELGAVVYDRNHVHCVMYNAEGNDIQVKDYDDPIRDLQGVNARVHTDTIYSQQRAASTVEF